MGGRTYLAPAIVAASVVALGLWLFVAAMPKPSDESAVRPPTKHLPTDCSKYYNDGTGRWIECMGVGLK